MHFQDSLNRWLKMQLLSINPLTIHHASRDTFLLTNKYQFISTAGNYPVLNWIIVMDLYRLTCWEVSVLALWSLMELWGGWWMIIVFWNSFNHTTHLFNELGNCSNHALVVIKKLFFCSVMVQGPNISWQVERHCVKAKLVQGDCHDHVPGYK